MRSLSAASIPFWLSLSLLLAMLIAATAGCGGGSSTTTRAAIPDGKIADLPALPYMAPAPHLASLMIPSTVLGSENWDANGDVSVSGDDLIINSDPGVMSWAIYRHTVMPNETATGRFEFTLTSTGDGAYIGIADYSDGVWDWYGPYTGTDMIDPYPGLYLSNGHFFAAVVAYNGAEVTVNTTTLYFDNGVAPPPSYLDDIRLFLDSNCTSCHNTAFQTDGVELESYSGLVAAAQDAKDKVNSNHKGTYTQDEQDKFTAWVDGGMPLGDAPTYTIDVLPQVFQLACIQCHDSTKTGGDRNGAPSGIDWDTYAAATISGTQPKQGNARAQNGTMPPAASGLSLDAQQKALFQAWIDAGWPE